MLMIKNNIIFVGHMGSGKTSIGKNLAKSLNIEFIDTDNEIEKMSGMTINNFFLKNGEKEFRYFEEKTILDILNKKSSTVIALGGGSFQNRTLRSFILEKNISIWLKCSLSILVNRLKNVRKRPLLNNTDIKNTILILDKERRDNYEKANIEYDVSKKQKKNINEELIKIITKINEN